MDDMDSFLQFFISRRIITQRNRFRARDINKVFSTIHRYNYGGRNRRQNNYLTRILNISEEQHYKKRVRMSQT